MKNRYVLPCLLFSVLSVFTACIQEEPLNSECDIEQCSVHLSNPQSVFFKEADTAINVRSIDKEIVFYVRSNVSKDILSAIPLSFKLTSGATIVPENGSVQDFSGSGVTYTVTSEDKLWNRTYQVRFKPMPELNPEFSFDYFELETSRQKYYQWFDFDIFDQRQDLWVTGNSGFALSRSSALPDEYPTVPSDTVALSGKAVKLETKNTGSFGAMVKMPIAAGNLFLGTFDTQSALKDPMKATQFGVAVQHKPLIFKGNYKFLPGEKFKNKNGYVYEDSIDAPDAYAVFYENTDANGLPVVLHGDDVLTNKHIVGLARVPHFEITGVSVADPWVYFEIPFEYKKEVDDHKLRNFGYNLAVVFTSSIYGAEFSGAEGSTLIVDDSEIVYE